MILIDFSHLVSRMLYTAISQSRPSKIKGKLITEEFTPYHRYLTLNSLRAINKNFSNKYGEVVICLDERGTNWRKKRYSGYKAKRKQIREESEINFEEYYEYLATFISELREIFPYKIIGVEGAEADDVIGVLAKENHKMEKILVVSEDKDFKQLLSYANVDLYAPVKKQFIKLTPKELDIWRINHVLLGDAIDGVPHIKNGTEFSPNFKTYLSKCDIHVKNVSDFLSLTISEKLMDEYDIEKVVKSGKNKGELTGEKDIYKSVGFGEKGAQKFAEDLENNLNLNTIYRANYERNKELVLFEYIPDYIQSLIITAYNNEVIEFNQNDILNYLVNHNLKTLVTNYDEFLPPKGVQVEETSSLSDWLD